MEAAKVPVYMDLHRNVEVLSAEAVVEAHNKDLLVQDKHEVKYHRYWYYEKSNLLLCLVEAPSKEAAEAVHREAQGLLADKLIEVSR